MIVATILSVLGFVLAAAVTQTKGLRLGGAILVPTLVVYALKDFETLPIFLFSTAVAYLVLWQAKERTLAYGRDEFLIAIGAGALIPVAGFLVIAWVSPGFVEVHPLVFAGSILPGLAAFNVSQTKPEYRRQDLAYLSALVVGLVLLGWLVIRPWTARHVADLTPLVLFAKTSDVAVLNGVVVEGYLAPNIIERRGVIALFVLGAAMAEFVRRQFGVRIGIISMALLALFALVSRWLLVLFVLSFVVSLLAMHLVHRATLLYGRVLINIGCAVGCLAALLFTTQLPIIRGFSALFVGVIAGVDAYAVHATPPYERRIQPFLAGAVFLGMALLLRTAVEPFRRGLFQTFSLVHVAVGAVVILGCLLVAYTLSVPEPDDEDVLSASVLSGGEG
ncbi:poly-gamma-glutamate biosynthesis protein PgsC/CapC [Halobellus rubicundus]|uniref:Poly-gamma-glutamate biosynthesis protein PgsC/CapC n=1 Tax=Halobellus rubicundus TaxID=2996466 RepID=A0ABD5MHS7_9EURY